VLLKNTLLFLLLFPSLLLAQTTEFKLSNGLKIIVREDHRSPVVVSQVWYRAGSLDEVNGKTGVAHVLEHMMFKGTKKIKAGEFSRLIAKAGGKENAFTGADYTCYFQQLEKSKLELSFELEADRMQNLNLSKEEFEKEIKVVMEERRWRTEDKPTSQVKEEFQSTLFKSHPYSRPVVGWMNDLENMTVEDAREWYKNWYAPNNATLVVVGDIYAKDVLNLAKKYFEKIPARKIPERKPQVEPKQNGERRSYVKAPSELSYILMGYPVPTLNGQNENDTNSWEPYALEVLSNILAGNSSSRLNQNIVRNQHLAISVSAGYDSTSRGRISVFELEGTPNDFKKISDLENALLQEIEKIKKDGVTQEELDRVKATVIASDVYQKDSMFGMAMEIGQLETMGYSFHLSDGYIEKINSVTSEQIKNVATKYLTRDNLSVVILDPQPMTQNASPKGRPHVH
jgi:zinc protease